MTIRASYHEKLRTIRKQIETIFLKEYSGLSELQKLGKHCTVCFQVDHDRTTCTQCSYCLKPGHTRNLCNINPNRAATVSTITSTTQATSINTTKTPRPYYRPYEGKPWFRRPNELDCTMLDKLQALGPPDNEKLTLAIDIEGCGKTLDDQSVGCVSICGWFGNKFGKVNNIYFAVVKQEKVVNPQTWITGNQIEDLKEGTPLEEVRNNTLRIIKNKRVIVHGGNDLTQLKINQKELIDNQVEVLDTATLFNKTSTQPI